MTSEVSSRATASLLWAACRPTADTVAVAAALDAGADLDLAAELATAQRVSPLLWRTLRSATDEGTPRALTWAQRLEREARRCEAQARLLLPRLAEFSLVPLAEADLKPLVFKGPVVAARYPAPGLRPMDDVDLLVPEADFVRALDVLHRAGWRPAPMTPGPHHESVLTHDDLPGLPIELHWDFETPGRRFSRLTAERLWSWRRADQLFGADVYTLPVEEELVMLAAHAAKPFHVFGRLLWSVDVAVVVATAERAGGVDWARVGDLADQTASRTAVAIAAAQATRLGATIPGAVLQHAAGPARRAALAPVLSHDWPVLTVDWDTRNHLNYALRDDWQLRLRLLREQAAQAGPLAPLRAVKLGARGVRRWFVLRRVARSQPADDLDRLRQP